MKCRVCRQPAVIDVRRQNANYCTDHFLRMCRDQVTKAIDEFEMLRPGERVLVAVSGGKDSLALWDILRQLGWEADGFCIALGIGEYSEGSTAVTRAFAEERGWPLEVVDLRDEHGFDVPTAAHVTHRVPCSACGLSKRHLFDDAARRGGYDAVATGHNLDDEAAVLFGNVLRWQVEYLGRQLPMLPARGGFPRKVKPLVRLSERETAAWCVLRGIDYVVEECPMAAGNKHLGYKAALNDIELASPGSKHAFYFGFLADARERFAGTVADDGGLGACERCGAPTTEEVCAFCRLVERTAGAEPVVFTGGTLAPLSMSRLLQAGDQVLLLDAKRRRYLVVLADGGEFHSHAGVVPHGELIGQPEGVTVRSTHGARYTAVRPTLSDYVLKMPRGAQVIYPKDLGPILLLADVFPGARILESGVGSGACSSALLRAGADVVGYEIREDFATRARRNIGGFLGEEALDRFRVELRDSYEGIDERDLDRIVLDLPEPWRVVPHAVEAMHAGGILVAYTPTIGQAAQLRASLDDAPFGFAETIEVLQRSWHIEGQSVRPDHRMVAHTGFLTSARLLG